MSETPDTLIARLITLRLEWHSGWSSGFPPSDIEALLREAIASLTAQQAQMAVLTQEAVDWKLAWGTANEAVRLEEAQVEALTRERDDLQQKCTEAFDESVYSGHRDYKALMHWKAETEAAERRATALLGYTLHNRKCPMSDPNWVPNGTDTGSIRPRQPTDPLAICTCGLAALLTAKEPT